MAKTNPEPRTSNPEPAPPAIAPDAKRQAFTAAADAIVTLDKRSDQIDVLRAVANFYGLQIGELK
jgi:hypothetical protein